MNFAKELEEKRRKLLLLGGGGEGMVVFMKVIGTKGGKAGTPRTPGEKHVPIPVAGTIKLEGITSLPPADSSVLTPGLVWHLQKRG